MAGGDSELFRVVEKEGALRILLEQLPRPALKTGKYPLDEALGRYLSREVISAEDVPSFARSTMDGYAVRARDTFGASEGSPVYLELSGRVLMGKAATVDVDPGCCCAIPTGGMLPHGADAVVMIEHTALAGETTVEIIQPVGPGDNVVQAGEDIRAGAMLFKAGRRLQAADLGALAAVGIGRVNVYEPLKIGILSTGDEIVDIDSDILPGQVRDINYFALAGLVRNAGAEPVNLGICRDDAENLRVRLRAGLDSCHLVLVSGGSSVGVADLTLSVINKIGRPGVLVHGVSVKPGKPTIIALIDGVPVFGLPGHPVSAMDIFRMLVEPVIVYFYGGDLAAETIKSRLQARLDRNIASVAGREDRIRITLEERNGELWALPVMGRSGLISLMVRADGIAVIPFEAEGVGRGDIVAVELI